MADTVPFDELVRETKAKILIASSAKEARDILKIFFKILEKYQSDYKKEIALLGVKAKDTSIINTLIQSHPDDFLTLLLSLMDGPDQLVYTPFRNLQFYHVLVLGHNVVFMLIALPLALLTGGLYVARNLYSLWSKNKLLDMDYAVEQFKKEASTDLEDKQAEEIITKKITTGFLDYFENYVEKVDQIAHAPVKEKNAGAKNTNDNEEESSPLAKAFWKIWGPTWRLFFGLGMTSWIVGFTCTLLGVTPFWPITVAAITFLLIIGAAYYVYSAIRTDQQVAQLKEIYKEEGITLDDTKDTALEQLFVPGAEYENRLAKRVHDFMEADFEAKERRLQLFVDGNRVIPADQVAQKRIEKLAKCETAKLTLAFAQDPNNSRLEEVVDKMNITSAEMEKATPVAIKDLKERWWSKDNIVTKAIHFLLSGASGFMGSSFALFGVSGIVTSVLTGILTASALSILGVVSGGLIVLFGAGIGLAMGVYYHKKRQQDVVENEKKMEELNGHLEDMQKRIVENEKIRQDINTLSLDYENLTKKIAKKNPGEIGNSIVQDKLKSEGECHWTLPKLNLPGYDNHAYFTQMRYKTTTGQKANAAFDTVLAGIDGTGTGFFLPRSTYVPNQEDLAFLIVMVGLAVTVALFHMPLIFIIATAAVTGLVFMGAKALRSVYQRHQSEAETFLHQEKLRNEYLVDEQKYLLHYRDALIDRVAILELADAEASIMNHSFDLTLAPRPDSANEAREEKGLETDSTRTSLDQPIFNPGNNH